MTLLMWTNFLFPTPVAPKKGAKNSFHLKASTGEQSQPTSSKMITPIIKWVFISWPTNLR